MGFFEFIKNHFLHVLPVLISGAFATAIIIERTRALFQRYPIKNPVVFFKQITESVLAGKIKEAIALCDQQAEKPTARIIRAGLVRAHHPEELVRHSLELAMNDAQQQVSRRTSFLATIANVATLFGLFGTIAGLIHSFEAVAHADPQQKSALLSAGIATAMNATMMGLAVAIPCMIAFSFLANRAGRLQAEFEDAAVRTLDLIQQAHMGLHENIHEAAHENGHDKKEKAKVVELRRSA